MLFVEKTAAEKRAGFKKALQSGPILRFPGAHAPLVAMEIERQKFEASIPDSERGIDR